MNNARLSEPAGVPYLKKPAVTVLADKLAVRRESVLSEPETEILTQWLMKTVTY